MNYKEKVCPKCGNSEDDLFDADEELGIDEPFCGRCNIRVSNFISKLAKARAEAIDDKIKNFWINEQNAKDYHIDIQKTNDWEKYIIYKKEKIWEFIIPNIK